MRKLFMIALCLGLLASCAKHPGLTEDGFFQLQHGQVKAALDTTDIFHVVTIKPDAFSLKQPGYLIGLEKSKRSTVGEAAWGMCDNTDGNPCIKTRSLSYAGGERSRSWLECRAGKFCAFQTNRKSILPTHIISYDTVENTGTDKCKNKIHSSFIYNAYGTQCNGGAAPCYPIIPKQPFPAQDQITRGYPNRACPTPPPQNRSVGDYKTLYKQGWDFIEKDFKEDLDNMVRKHKATHIFLFSMGWNTSQWEAISNFNDLQDNIIKAAESEGYGAKFRPIFINITWPSSWAKKPVGFEDFPVMANDADEIGMTFASHIIQNAMAQVGTDTAKPKIILVGHSLGALLITRAADSGHFVAKNEPSPIDLVIGLEGAFTVKRFVDKSFRKYLWGFQDPEMVKHSFYTSSVHDSATRGPSIGISPYVGSNIGYKMASQLEYQGIFNHRSLDGGGRINGTVPTDGKITFIDASKITYRNMPGTGGQAHSDIYNPETGVFMWQIIRACTLDNQ